MGATVVHGVRIGDSGVKPLPARKDLTGPRLCVTKRTSEPVTSAAGPGSGRRREELQRDPVLVAEGDPRTVVGVHDSAMCDAQLIDRKSTRLNCSHRVI